MLHENNPEGEKKRVLKKVRRNFLNKRGDIEEQTLVDPTTRCLSINEAYPLNSSIGLAEVDHKICIGTQYVNLSYDISKMTVEDRFSNTVITINFVLKEDKTTPWQYTTKRLESYGDLELATWAHRITNYNTNFSKVMVAHEDLVNSGDPQILETLKVHKKEAIETSKNIESNYAFYKSTYLLSREKCELVSITYNEKILKEMEFTPETFVTWARKNGLPATLADDSLPYRQIVKSILECNLLAIGPVLRWPDYEAFLFTAKGLKKKVIIQSYNILEPTEKGFFFTAYIIPKQVPLKTDIKTTSRCLLNLETRESTNGSKSIKLDSESEKNINQQKKIENIHQS